MEDFNLLSFELSRWSGATIKYTKPGDDGPEEFNVKFARPVHPDLRGMFEDGFHNLARWSLGYTEELTDIVVHTGIVFPKDGYIQLMAVVNGPAGMFNVKSPKFPIPPEERDLIDGFVAEVKAYIEGKSAQLSIFGEDDTPEDLLGEASE